MKIRTAVALVGLVALARLNSFTTFAQFSMSLGPYAQNFDALASSGTANAWVNNSTLLGWYATRNGTNAMNYRAGDGGNNTGDLWSYGVAGVSNANDRALGSVASGSATPIHFGLRFTNDTAATFTNIVISYTGEQWRNGSNSTPQTLSFSYQVGSAPLTNPAVTSGWISFPALNFVTPNPLTNPASGLDGNAATNRQVIANVFLAGVSVGPGQELFFRWSDINDPGNDHSFGIDDLSILYNLGDDNPPAAPIILSQPQSRSVTVGDNVQFTTLASGNPAPTYQWQFNGTNLTGAVGVMLTLTNVTIAQAGDYRVMAANSQGAATSEVATLTVSLPSATFSLLTYNVKGNGATNWSTNATQVQAIARQLQYLQPDVVTFNEIPWDLRYEMTNFMTAFLPGYKLALSSGTDGSICSAIVSRHPITRASKWLDGVDLRSFGYSNANNALDNFTRDLFEAQISVPGFARPLHVFTTHLKATASGEYEDNAAKRAAEAAAITNFFTTNLFALYPYDPYTLSGDMNASDTNELCIQTLLGPTTGLRMTYPRNPVTGSLNTYSTAFANPSSRLDYIFPGPLLYSNIKTSQVFRSSLVTPLPPGLNSNDSQVASDHYPVLMVFNNPYDKPFKLLSITRTNPTVTLKWESVFGQSYRVESSSNLTMWLTQANNLVATGTNFSYSTNLNDPLRYFRVVRVP